MRLTSARVRGFGRLVDASVNLDAKLIAVVGPNEAGKSTLLEALAHLSDGGAVPVSRRARGAVGVADNTEAVEATFQLDEDDRAALAGLDLEEQPKRATVARTMSGEVSLKLQPEPCKPRAVVDRTAIVLHDTVARQPDLAYVEDDTTWTSLDGDPDRTAMDDLQLILDAVQELIAAGSEELDDATVGLAKELADALDPGQDEAAELRHVLVGLVDWVQTPSPRGAARDIIWHRAPSILLFGESDRALKSSYVFDEDLARNPPGALANLAATGGLDLVDLLAYHSANDVTRRQTALKRANRRLEDFFKDAWRQSELSVQLNIDGELLRVQLEEDNGSVTVFDERSAGLRMFVALVSFLATHASDVPPILLVDEAENHLHLDAQADLINMFVAQDKAAKIIYTTHSPACLPPDLGTGIRSIVPSSLPDRSDVKNSFWQGAAGYSPLMMAMGASAAAFTPTRRVVLAEGAADMLLYPSLIRAATDLQELPYQIAPGLSEVPKELISALDLEAAKVAYLVDDDKGGRALKKTLVNAGVPERLVVSAEVPGVEALVSSEDLRSAYVALLPECNVDATVDDAAIPVEPDGSSSMDETIRSWVATSGLDAPGKVAVGNWLVQNAKANSTAAQRELLQGLHDRLVLALG